MNFSYSKGEEVMVNTKSLKMTTGGRANESIFFAAHLKEISLARMELG